MNNWHKIIDTFLINELGIEIDVIKNANSFTELGIDSFGIIYLVQNIETLLNIKIKDEDIFKISNYTELTNIICKIYCSKQSYTSG